MKRCARSGCTNGVAQPSTGRRRRFCSNACRVANWRKRSRRSRLAALHSSASVEWATDPAVFAEFDAELGPFTLDPCATPENTKCPHFFTRDDDGLSHEWTGRVWMNPPYGRSNGRSIGDWMRKAWESSQMTAELVACLVPVRTGSAWWQDYAMRGEIRFLRGRLKFGESANSAPFDSALVLFRNEFS
jgi:site-specific DNA-methyltransferase (adenine-specific)